MSSPAMISFLSVEASASSGNTVAGRRLANSPISLRRRRIARSGFFSNGTLSHRGSPTAPNSTASTDRASAITLSVIGTSCFSRLEAPTSPSLMSKRTARRLSNQSITRRTCFIASGPIPSPGRKSIVLLAAMSVSLA